MIRFLVAVACCLAAWSSRADASSDTGHTPLVGVYKIYGGSLGDEQPPSAKDKKIMFSIEGKGARDLFNAIGPDVKDACTEGMGIRVRKRDKENISCSKSKEGGYSCNFGFDLVTGKSIGGIIC